MQSHTVDSRMCLPGGGISFPYPLLTLLTHCPPTFLSYFPLLTHYIPTAHPPTTAYPASCLASAVMLKVTFENWTEESSFSMSTFLMVSHLSKVSQLTTTSVLTVAH